MRGGTRSRRNSQFGPGHWERVEELLREAVEPRTALPGHLRRKRELAISHETIYRHVWRDLKAGGTPARASARCAQAVPQTLWTLRQPWAPGRQTDDQRASRLGRGPPPDRPLGNRHDDGREPGRKQRLHPDPGRAQKRLRAHRQTPSAHRGGSQPGAPGADGTASATEC